MSNIVVFSNWQFLGIFLPVFLILYYIAPIRWRNALLFAGSIVFYAAGSPSMVVLLIGLTIANYLMGSSVFHLEKAERNHAYREGVPYEPVAGMKRRLALIVVLDAGVLAACKVLALLPSFDFSLPLGLSFYIFKMISYQADLYRGQIRRKPRFINTAAYFTMFPQITQGPIMRYGDGFGGSRNAHKVTGEQFEDGLVYLVLGMGMKVLLADRIGILWNEITKIGYESISTPLAWLGAYGYSFELFYDFWGYSLMAAGIGMMLGFPFIDNFIHPYAAGSVSEFYRRWHATLGAWFRDYVYFPLGGSRCSTAKTIRNLLVVWLLTGLWHGGTVNFVIWGIVLGLLIISEKFLLKTPGTKRLAEIRAAKAAYKEDPYNDDLYEQYQNSRLSAREWMGLILGRIHVLVLIPLTWVVFAIVKLPDLGVYFARLFPFFGIGTTMDPGDFIRYLRIYWPFFAVSAVLCVPAVFRKIVDWRKKPWMIALLVVLFWVSMYFSIHSAGNKFMYFSY